MPEVCNLYEIDGSGVGSTIVADRAPLLFAKPDRVFQRVEPEHGPVHYRRLKLPEAHVTIAPLSPLPKD